MTGCSDLPEMRRLGLDEATLDRSIAGRIAHDDAPPGYSEVALVLQGAAVTGDRHVLGLETEPVALTKALVSASGGSG